MCSNTNLFWSPSFNNILSRGPWPSAFSRASAWQHRICFGELQWALMFSNLYEVMPVRNFESPPWLYFIHMLQTIPLALSMSPGNFSSHDVCNSLFRLVRSYRTLDSCWLDSDFRFDCEDVVDDDWDDASNPNENSDFWDILSNCGSICLQWLRIGASPWSIVWRDFIGTTGRCVLACVVHNQWHRALETAMELLFLRQPHVYDVDNSPWLKSQ